MSFENCINKAEADGDISPEQAEAMRRRYHAHEANLRLELGPEAAAEAARRAFEDERQEVARRRLLALRQAERMGVLTKMQDAFQNLRGFDDPAEFLVLLIEDVGKVDGRKLPGDFSSVSQRHQSLRRQTYAILSGYIDKYVNPVIGSTRNKTTLDNVIRELSGQETGDNIAKAHAKAWGDATEFLRKRFNAMGGSIGRLEGWVPQGHDQLAIARAGYEEWRKFTMPRLNRQKMIDRDTGVAFSDEKLELVLRETWDALASEGAVQMVPALRGSKKSLVNRRAEARFLHFLDADNWLEYQNKFGDKNPLRAMIGHIETMTRDVAALEILGPNPDAMLQLLMQRAEKWAGQFDAKNPDRKVLGLRRSMREHTQDKLTEAASMWEIYTGRAGVPGNVQFSTLGRVTRNMATASYLQSAAVSSVTDFGTQALASAYAGLPATKVIRNYIKMVNPADPEMRQISRQIGLAMDEISVHSGSQARYVGDFDASGFTNRLADATMHVTGLSAHTSIGRYAFGLEMFGFMARNVGKQYQQLPKSLQELFGRYGIHNKDWDIIRKVSVYEPKDGLQFIRPQELRAHYPDNPHVGWLADRLLEMVHTETNMAVPTSTLRSRAQLVSDSKPGTFVGELARSASTFRAFPMTILYTHGARIMQNAMEQGVFDAAKYALTFGATMTAFGALAYQLKTGLLAGRDPINMNPQTEEGRKFWKAAVLQGGGLGIFGDLVFADTTRYGQNFEGLLGGPVAGYAGSWLDLVKNPSPASLVTTAKYNLPFTRPWWGRLMMDRWIWDKMQQMADPDAQAKWARRATRLEGETGQKYYWQAGDNLPARAPDMAAAIEKP